MAPYELQRSEKLAAIVPELDRLTRHHYRNCERYRWVIDGAYGGLKVGPYETIEELPFVPVSLFKEFELHSLPPSDIFRVLSSSGTTGQAVSRVYLDRATAANQSNALVRIMQHFLGKERRPMVVLDHPRVIANREAFSARGAGILGLMQFGRQPIYAFRDDMSFDFDHVVSYLDAHRGKPVLFFGFTFMVWQHAIAALSSSGLKLPGSNGTLIHSGGWKKLENAKVDPATFNQGAIERLGVARSLNFYGMVEQVGSVFFENDVGALHAPVFADVIIRDPFTLRPLKQGERGLVQVVSVLPGSYPGHSILTEDIGALVGEDGLPSGMNGRYFRVEGRVPKSEVRGCSDTYVQRA